MIKLFAVSNKPSLFMKNDHDFSPVDFCFTRKSALFSSEGCLLLIDSCEQMNSRAIADQQAASAADIISPLQPLSRIMINSRPKPTPLHHLYPP